MKLTIPRVLQVSLLLALLVATKIRPSGQVIQLLLTCCCSFCCCCCCYCCCRFCWHYYCCCCGDGGAAAKNPLCLSEIAKAKKMLVNAFFLSEIKLCKVSLPMICTRSFFPFLRRTRYEGTRSIPRRAPSCGASPPPLPPSSSAPSTSPSSGCGTRCQTTPRGLWRGPGTSSWSWT